MNQLIKKEIEFCWSPQELDEMSHSIESCLLIYKLKVSVVDYFAGSSFTLFRLKVGAKIQGMHVKSLITELCRALNVINIKVIDFLPGTPYIGLLVTNKYRRVVPFLSCFNRWLKHDDIPLLSIMLGENIIGEPIGIDLAQCPHLLISGSIASGKSTLIHSIIMSVIYRLSPKEIRLIIFDTSGIELTPYFNLPHLVFPVVDDVSEVIRTLDWIIAEMNKRYKLFSALGVKNIDSYNEKIICAEKFNRLIPDPFWRPADVNDVLMPFLKVMTPIMVVMDDYIQFVSYNNEIGHKLITLSQSANIVGIHFILSTRNLLSSSIDNQLKINISTRISLTMPSKKESRSILNQNGAEELFGNGDMLYLSPYLERLERIQGALVTDEDIDKAIQYSLKWERVEQVNLNSSTDYSLKTNEFNEPDPLFYDVVEFISETNRVSISGIQRKFRIGYNRSAIILEQLEMQGLVSIPDHNGTRTVLI